MAEGVVQPLPEYKGHCSVSLAFAERVDVGSDSLVACTYFDDGCFMVYGKSHADIESTLTKLARIIRDVFQVHGMMHNFSENNSEAFVIYRGRGAHAMNASLHERGYRLKLPDFNGKS